MADANYGGYNYSFVKKKLEKFTCNTICTKVLRDPHLTKCCGQSVCESCLNCWFTRHRKESCPHCRAEGEDFQHFLDKRLKREIDSLRIFCTHKEEGCQWVGELGSVKDHLQSANGCGYVEVKCPNRCVGGAGTMNRKELENHLKNECNFRQYQCEHCGHCDKYLAITGKVYLRGSYYRIPNYESHYTECPEFPLECPNECGLKRIKRKDMEDHRSQCPEEEVECPFEEAGCKQKLVRRELEQHLATTQQKHLLMVMGAYKEMKNANAEMKKELEDHRRQITMLTGELEPPCKRKKY